MTDPMNPYHGNSQKAVAWRRGYDDAKNGRPFNSGSAGRPAAETLAYNEGSRAAKVVPETYGAWWNVRARTGRHPGWEEQRHLITDGADPYSLFGRTLCGKEIEFEGSDIGEDTIAQWATHDNLHVGLCRICVKRSGKPLPEGAIAK